MAGSKDRETEGSKPPPEWVAALETVGASAVTLLVGAWLRPADPFFLKEAFSWPALAPIVMGLRYGFAHGFGCAFLLVLALAICWRQQWVGMTEFPSQLGVGLLVTGMVAGEFADVWMRRVRRTLVVSDFRRLRLEEFARAYHLLKVSHDTLEQRVAGSTQNLREALQTLRRQLLDAKDPARPLLGLEGAIVTLFSSYGFVQSAALFAVGEDGEAAPEPAATQGDVKLITIQDPLIRQAIDRMTMVSVRPDMPPAERGTQLLAAIPIADARGRLWAVLAVREMLFVAFQADNLKLLAVMGGHVGDILAYGAGWSSGSDESSAGFRQALERAIEDRRRYDLHSTMVSLAFPSSELAASIVQAVMAQRRGLDQALLVQNRSGEPRVILLMPFTNELGAHGYLARLERMVRERHGRDLAGVGIEPRVRVIDKRDEATSVVGEICRATDVPEESVLG